MATISPANSTITDTISLLLLDTSKGSNIQLGVTNNFITYILTPNASNLFEYLIQFNYLITK